ncbi:hypothetical protein QVG61_07325 [Thiohalobacter sp. IOR34]|uniref:Alvin_2107 family globule sulfur oxidation protein n=1 Tax=Thiohalobacter sp. IOR34 TaxID=3057176 RepID=UPI0025B14DE6|nr:hypothetical protein [Thiohalobacter sp. IOR34]WJW74331.1 hypothetical protein QVG61_07325 [Thiohalobacter sp. IOR34]
MNPHQDYYDAVKKMEEAGVDPDYIIGWQSGYWLDPEREEQRVTEAYEAGYEKGKAKDASGYEAWIKN